MSSLFLVLYNALTNYDVKTFFEIINVDIIKEKKSRKGNEW